MPLLATILAVAQPAPTERPTPCKRTDVVLLGRVESERSESLPSSRPDRVSLYGLHVYELRVLRLIKGREARATIVARQISDPSLVANLAMTFRLCRASDRTYWIVSPSRGER